MDPVETLQAADEQRTLHSPLATVLRRKPITVPPDADLRSALEQMNAHKISSMLIADPDSGKPLGMFTLRDLLKRVALESCDLTQPVSQVMSGRLITLKGQATAYHAAVTMARHGVHHIVVVDDLGRLLGIVSQGDLFALERAGVREVSGDIRAAQDIDSLRQSAGEIRRLADQMVAQGVGAEPLTHFVSSLNDQLTIRIIELTASEFDLPEVEWCWLAFGSEGRFEQTFSTDQDNGIIFAVPPGREAEAIRARFLPFAQEVNRRLDACGFDLCKGNIMAGNPECCLSLEEWQGRFLSWLQAANPQALLNATIFFDFRALYGEEGYAEELRRWLLARTQGAALFLRFMAENALKSAPPIGLIRDFVYDKDEKFPHTIDLKALGSRPFVDAARIFALASGIGHTGTAQRLRAAAAQMKFGRDDIHAVIEGFFYIQLLRLRHQRAGVAEGGANRIDPDTLNELDRHILKESFKQAKKLQGRLQLDYRL